MKLKEFSLKLCEQLEILKARPNFENLNVIVNTYGGDATITKIYGNENGVFIDIKML